MLHDAQFYSNIFGMVNGEQNSIYDAFILALIAVEFSIQIEAEYSNINIALNI